MEGPKCKTCGKTHFDRVCPENKKQPTAGQRLVKAAKQAKKMIGQPEIKRIVEAQAEAHAAMPEPKAGFDRKAYQREYMREYMKAYRKRSKA